MKIKYLLTGTFTVLLLSSCKKNVVDISPEYEGEWHSQITTGADGIPRERYFIIDDDQAIFGELCELAPLGHNCIRKFSGDVKLIIINPRFSLVL